MLRAAEALITISYTRAACPTILHSFRDIGSADTRMASVKASTLVGSRPGYRQNGAGKAKKQHIVMKSGR